MSLPPSDELPRVLARRTIRARGADRSAGRRAGRPRRHRAGPAVLHRRGQGGAADPQAGAGAAGRQRLRLRVVERHRDRLHLRRPRHLPQVQGAGLAGHAGHPARRADVQPRQLDAGWRLACLVQATRDLDVDVPPLTTRPKAATVGVGRQVILRPAVQKRYVELTEPTLDRPAHRPRPAARRDRRPRAGRRPPRAAPAARRCCAQADFKVTAVIVDEALIDVEPGDTTAHALRHRLRPRHHHRGGHPARPGHRHAGRGGLDAQQAAALRRRRDHPDQRHDDGPGRPRPAAATPPRADPGRAGRAGLRARAASTRRTSTRSRSPATPR